MAITGWPTEASEGQVATELRWRKMARLWCPDGIAAGVLNEMAPTFDAGQVTIATGAAWIDGHYAEVDAPVTVATAADGQVVLRYTYAGSIFAIVFVAGQTSPVRNATQYEIALAQVTAGAMTDLRVRVGPGGGALGVAVASGSTQGMTVANLPAMVRELRVLWRGSCPTATGALIGVRLRVNNIATAIYRTVAIYADDNGTPTRAGAVAASDGIVVGYCGDDNGLSGGVIDLPDTAGPQPNVAVLAQGGGSLGSLAGNNRSMTGWGAVTLTPPVASLQLELPAGSLWRAGSRMAVYGIGL